MALRPLSRSWPLLGALLLASPLQAQTAATLASQPQTPQTQARDYAIEAGPLSTVLSRFAGEAGLLLSADGELTRGKQSPGLRGRYTVPAGLEKLLEGTGLRYRLTDDGGLVLERADEGHTLAPVAVTGTAQSRYESRYADTALRLPKDVADVPRSLDVIPEQLLLDQQSRELAEVFRLAPNVTVSDGYGGTREHAVVRGFSRNDNFYRNGVPFVSDSRIDPATVDNIQILKGPVADIGRMAPSGLINIQTKQPTFQRQGSLSTAFDEHGQRRLTADTTGPVAGSDTFAYRVTGSLEDSETFRDTNVDRKFLSSSLLWQAPSGFRLSVNHEFSEDKREIDRGLVTVPLGGDRRRVANVDRDTRYDGEVENERDEHYHLVQIDNLLPLGGSGWDLDSTLFYSREGGDDIRAEVVNVSNTGVLTRRVGSNRDRERDTVFVRSQLIGSLGTALPVDLAAGLEYRREAHEWKNFNGALQTGGTVDDPDSFTLVNDIGNPQSGSGFDTQVQSRGVFAVADVALLPSLTATLGLRYEVFETEFQRRDLLGGAVTEADSGDQNKLTKGLGLVWSVTRDLNLYFNYADTFEPQSIFIGQTRVAKADPREGRQYEVGAKWHLLDDRHFLTVALFDLEEDNVVQFENGEPVLNGGQTSKGAELSLVSNPVDGFNLRAAVGVVDAELVTNDADDGNRPANVPTTTASLWTSYEFQSAERPLRGLGLGGGVSFAGDRYGDSAGSFELDGYTVLDAGVWYYLPLNPRERLRFDVGVKNLTDEEYYSASGGSYRISVGNPRTVFGGVRLEF